MKTPCEERDRLQRAYAAFVSDCQRAAEVLRERTGVMPAMTYRVIRDGAAAAHRRSEEVKAQLDAHVAEHHCALEPKG